MPIGRVLLVIVLAAMAAGCDALSSPMPTPGPPVIGQLQVTALAGPVCPVESEPPDPACAPRTVADAPIFVQSADGRDILVAEGRTNGDGVAVLQLPAGAYLVLGGDVESLMGRPEPVRVTLREHEIVPVELAWDTGIR